MMPLAAWLPESLGLAFAGLAAIGLIYQAVQFWALGSWFARPCPLAETVEPVTLLKPLHGAEPQLLANLESFLRSDHRGPIQMVCGVNAPGDAALEEVAKLQARHPTAAIDLSAGPCGPAANAKVANLAAMMPLAAHALLIMSDSDMAVSPDYLPRVLGALAQPGVGAVSCLYAGRGDAGFWSRIGAATISYMNLPGMVVALRFGLRQPCMGSTIALKRETLDRVGGFAAFRDELADDYAIGAAVNRLGLQVAVPPMLLFHAGDEASFTQLWRHHLRWLVTLRGIVGFVHAGTIVTHGLVLALIATALAPKLGLPLLLVAAVLRWAVKRRIDRLAGLAGPPFALLILADGVEFAIFCVSLFARKIDWRGSRLVMAPDGRIQAHT